MILSYWCLFARFVAFFFLRVTTGLSLAGGMNASQWRADVAGNDVDRQSGSLSSATRQIKEGYSSRRH
jgi:hypothetical protein